MRVTKWHLKPPSFAMITPIGKNQKKRYLPATLTTERIPRLGGYGFVTN